MNIKTTEKTINELNLEDDFLFAKVMGDAEICRKVLEMILNISIEKILFSSTQRTIDLLFEGKGIRLDCYVNDDKETIYNIEMQRGKRRELPKRSRYYQSSIDMDLISAGEPYTLLKNTFIIFICTFDPFGEGRHTYTFQNTCQENPQLPLNDETTKIFLNTKGKLDDIDNAMRDFLTYIENTTDSFAEQTNSSLVKDIHKKVIEVKQNNEMEVEYMTLLQRDRENIEIGTEKMAALTKILLKENRSEDLERALEDPEYRTTLFIKYQIDSK